MKPSARRELKYEAIYSAALKVFAEFGFRKTTIADIADELGTAKSSLYFYVTDKRELYVKSVEFGLKRWQDKVRAAVAHEKDIVDQFLVMAHKAYEYLARDPCLHKILMRDPSLFPLYPSQDPYSDINRDSVGMLKTLLKRGIAEGRFRRVNIDSTAPLIFSLYVMLIQKTYLHPEGELPRAMFEDAVDLILNGLITGPKERKKKGGSHA